MLDPVFALLLLTLASPPAGPRVRTPETVTMEGQPVELARLARPVLAMAFCPSGRVLLLEDDRVSLWRLAPNAMVHEEDWPAPARPETIRHPGGLIHGTGGTPDFWVLRSGWPEAFLLREEGGLSQAASAALIPWPGAPGGLHFRAGTNLIEGVLEGLGPGARVALSEDGVLAIDGESLLHATNGDAPALRLGSAVTHPWSDIAVASSSATRAPDTLLSVALDTRPVSATQITRLDGLIRALAVAVNKDAAHLLVAVDGPTYYSVVGLWLHRGPAPR
jgi:hypothetical protein